MTRATMPADYEAAARKAGWHFDGRVYSNSVNVWRPNISAESWRELCEIESIATRRARTST